MNSSPPASSIYDLGQVTSPPCASGFFTDKMRMVIVPSSWNYENSTIDTCVHLVMSLHVLACRLSVSSDILAAGTPQPGDGDSQSNWNPGYGHSCSCAFFASDRRECGRESWVLPSAPSPCESGEIEPQLPPGRREQTCFFCLFVCLVFKILVT